MMMSLCKKIKEMVLMNTTTQTIHADHYGHAVNKIAFYLPRVTINGTNHCGKQDMKRLREVTGSWIKKGSVIIMIIFLFS